LKTTEQSIHLGKEEKKRGAGGGEEENGEGQKGGRGKRDWN